MLHDTDFLGLYESHDVEQSFRERGVECLFKARPEKGIEIQMGYEVVEDAYILRLLAVQLDYMGYDTATVFDFGALSSASEEAMTDAAFTFAEEVACYNKDVLKFYRRVFYG